MNRGALAEDAVSIHRLRARGVAETSVRRQLAIVAVPATSRFVFIRRVVLRAAPDQVGQAMTMALNRLAEEGRSDVLSFADFPAVAVACARAALSGGLGGGWHWRALGLPQSAGPGAALGTLLSAYPLEAGAAVAALAAAGLLAPVWRDLSEPVAARLVHSLAEAGGFRVPAWPSDPSETPPALKGEAVLSRAAAFWRPATRDLPRRHEAIRAAAVLSLLRWSPLSLRTSGDEIWPLLLARLADAEAAPPPQPARLSEADAVLPPAAPARTAPKVPARASVEAAALPPLIPPPPAAKARTSPPAGPAVGAPEPVRFDAEREAPEPTPMRSDYPADTAVSLPHGEMVSTQWGGVLFLINALNRLDIAARLEAYGRAAPSGFRLLVDLGRALGMPADEPLSEFLAAQDVDSATPPAFFAALLVDLEAIYTPLGAWPASLAQPARLLANETHLDLDLLVSRVDIGIRRAGLDIDPGWVPWLGRIVAFRYPNLPLVQVGEG